MPIAREIWSWAPLSLKGIIAIIGRDTKSWKIFGRKPSSIHLVCGVSVSFIVKIDKPTEVKLFSILEMAFLERYYALVNIMNNNSPITSHHILVECLINDKVPTANRTFSLIKTKFWIGQNLLVLLGHAFRENEGIYEHISIGLIQLNVHQEEHLIVVRLLNVIHKRGADVRELSIWNRSSDISCCNFWRIAK